MKGLGVADVPMIARLFVIIGVAIGIGIYVLSNVQKNYDTSSVVNETVTISGTTGTLAYGYVNGNPSECYNNTATGGDSTRVMSVPGECNISTGSAEQADKVVLQINGTDVVNSVNVSYTHWNNNPGYMASINASKGTAQLATWLPVIGLVLAATIVIAVLSGMFKGRGI